MRTLDTRRQLTVLQLLLITSNPLLLCPEQDVNCTDVKTVETDVTKMGEPTKMNTTTVDNNAYDDSFVYNLTDSSGKLNISEV